MLCFLQLTVVCFYSDERREASRLIYRLDTRGAGLYPRQTVTLRQGTNHTHDFCLVLSYCDLHLFLEFRTFLISNDSFRYYPQYIFNAFSVF